MYIKTTDVENLRPSQQFNRKLGVKYIIISNHFFKHVVPIHTLKLIMDVLPFKSHLAGWKEFQTGVQNNINLDFTNSCVKNAFQRFDLISGDEVWNMSKYMVEYMQE